MLTPSQISDFCRAAADWATLGRNHDIVTSCPFATDAVNETQASVSIFIAEREDWKEPGVAAHRDTPFGRLYVFDAVRRTGADKRGTLFVMDFGAVRAICFTGEQTNKTEQLTSTEKPKIDGIYCRTCRAPLANTYSWQGYCVVCAEPYVMGTNRENLIESLRNIAAKLGARIEF